MALQPPPTANMASPSPSPMDKARQIFTHLDAWKRSRGFCDISVLHSWSTRHLKSYLRDKALAAAEEDDEGGLQITQHRREHLSTSEHDPATRAEYAEGPIALAHWDLCDYLTSLEGLETDLSPALGRSCRFLAACAVAKAAQLCFWSASEHPIKSFVLTFLTGYHAVFALAYRASLYLAHRCRRQAEELKVKARNRTVSEDDVRAWDGFACRALNYVADERAMRRLYYTSGIWLYTPDFILLDCMKL
ncbi:hypothetical protein C8A03DRAFT_35392 [Achaetomium macrosporum]|uniref:Uncharacterized protein n=1 Tax=Achaetomium macrosporum TaxID=79813 RepID=A0AAN7H9N9_9PEZI|nr:hypothetical protein C8A03DRAFT_35392 [Achaetomium macrosporum]